MLVQSAIFQTRQRLNDIVAQYNIKAIYALFSGGDDSTVMSYLSSFHPLFQGVVFANTLTGDRETIGFVRNTAKIMEWALHEVKPEIRDRYPSIIVTHGIPNAPMHPIVYGNLKGKPFDSFAVEQAKTLGIKRKELLFVSGIRRAESTKRMKSVQLVKEIYSDGKKKNLRSVWGAPIFDWQRSDLEDIFSSAGELKRNEHAFKFGNSRECGCKATEGAQDPILEKKFNKLAWERRLLQEQLVQAAYRLQEFDVENGLIDRQDATIPSYAVPDSTKGIQQELFPYRYDSDDEEINGVPYLCVACDSQLNGDDPDKEMLIARLEREGDND